MRKLTQVEQNACRFLSQFRNGYCPGVTEASSAALEVRRVLDNLVKKRRAFVTTGDDGPVYSLTSEGEADAAA